MPDLGEFLIIGIVALLVIPPERLPQAARAVGQWIGRMQNYVAQVRVDIDREFHLADLRRIGEEARAEVRSVETAIQGAVAGVQNDLNKVRAEVSQSLGGGASWAGGGMPQPPTTFPKRYKPRPSIDDLTQEIERLKSRLDLPSAPLSGARQKFSPRSRINRPRVRR
jgi:sec-independent protein translocase protein TatB